MTYRVVYGETMPAWERTFPTMREAKAFAKKHEGFGDVIFSIRKVIPGEPPQSMMAAFTPSAKGGNAMTTLSPYLHPGKFEGELNITAYAYQLSLDGSPDEEVGDVNAAGWFGLMRGPFDPDCADATTHSLTPADLAYLKTCAGVILQEGSTGFVTATWYDDGQESVMEDTWTRLEVELEAVL